MDEQQASSKFTIYSVFLVLAIVALIVASAFAIISRENSQSTQTLLDLAASKIGTFFKVEDKQSFAISEVRSGEVTKVEFVGYSLEDFNKPPESEPIKRGINLTLKNRLNVEEQIFIDFSPQGNTLTEVILRKCLSESCPHFIDSLYLSEGEKINSYSQSQQGSEFEPKTDLSFVSLTDIKAGDTLQILDQYRFENNELKLISQTIYAERT